MNGNGFLQSSHSAEAQHCPFSPTKRQV